MRTAIIHIGTEKTGTTTVQAFLELNRDRLPGLGFAFPRSSGTHKSQNLVICALPDGKGEDILLSNGLDAAEKRARHQAETPRRLAEELQALPPHVHTVIFSDEHCHSRLTQESDVARLRGLLAPFFDRLKVFVYLRRQDQLATSLYSTSVRCGETRAAVLPPVDAASPYFNYQLLLERWAAVFSESMVAPRLFDRRAFVAGDLIEDFATACGLSGTHRLERPADRNEEIAATAQEFLRHLNMRAPWTADGTGTAGRRLLEGLAVSELKGAGRRPPRDAAIRFAALFDRSNEEVRRRWFPARSSLFGDDFSMYPEHEAEDFGFADAVDVSGAIMAALAAEVAFGRGRLAQDRKDWAEAEANLRGALELDPSHAGARRMLEKLAPKRAAVGRPTLLGRIARATGSAARTTMRSLAR